MLGSSELTPRRAACDPKIASNSSMVMSPARSFASAKLCKRMKFAATSLSVSSPPLVEVVAGSRCCCCCCCSCGAIDDKDASLPLYGKDSERRRLTGVNKLLIKLVWEVAGYRVRSGCCG